MKTHRNGFTLIELLAVVTIMAVLILVAIPALDSTQRLAVQTAARQVNNTLSLTRQWAITQRANTRFVIAVSSRSTNVVYNGKLFANTTPGRAVLRGFLSAKIQVDDNLPGPLNTIWIALTDWQYLTQGVIFVGQGDMSTIAMVVGTNDCSAAFASYTAVGPQLFLFGGKADNSGWVTGGVTNLLLTAFLQFSPSGLGVTDGTNMETDKNGVQLAQGTVENPTNSIALITSTNKAIFVSRSDLNGRTRVEQ